MTNVTTLQEANSELTLRLRQQKLAAEFAIFVLRTDELQPVLDEACRIAAKGMECTLAKVLEFLPDEDCLIMRAGVGWRPGEVGHARLGSDLESPAGYAFQTGRSVLSNHLAAETRFRTPRLLVDHGVHRAFNVLVAAAEGHYGVLEVDSPDERDFSISDTAFLETLAATLAQAIGKARRIEELRASRAFSQGVLDASPDCIKVLSAEGTVVFMSRRGVEMNELACLDDVKGKDYGSMWPPQQRGLVGAALRRASSGQSARVEGYCPTAKGKPRWWDLSFAPIPGAGGGPFQVVAVSRDVSERHLADEALRRSEAHWRGLFEKLQEGFIIAELVRDVAGVVRDWRFVEVNDAFEVETGLSRDASIGRTIREVIPGIEQLWIDTYASIVETGRPASFTAEARDLHRTFDVRAFPVGGDRAAVLFMDVTQRHRADACRAALPEIQERFLDLKDPSDIAHAMSEVVGRLLKAARVGYGTIGPLGDLLTIVREWTIPGVKDATGTHDMRRFGSYMGQLHRGESVVVADTRTDPRTSGDQEPHQEFSTGALVNLPVIEGGRLVAMFYVNSVEARVWTVDEVAFMRDVAERTRIAIERRRAEGKLQELTSSLERQVTERTRDRDRIWRLSRDMLGVADDLGVWLTINPAWSDILGWSEDEILGRTSAWLQHPDDVVRTQTAREDLAAGAKLVSFDNRWRTRSGEYRFLSWTAVPYEGMTYVVGRDVTEERLQAQALQDSQAALRQSQKMEAVGQLTGGLAHDFNNLLTGIIGGLELLQLRMAQGRTKDAGRYIDMAQGAAKRAAALTHRLLAFSRRQTLDPRPTDVNRLAAGMEDSIRRTVGPQVEIEMVRRADLWTTLVDPGQLENALLNLCINSRDAMPDGGHLTIETGHRTFDARTATVQETTPGEYVSLSVSDTGTGMPPDVVARAFDPFFTTKPIGQGTGLGLSMIYGFARQSGGQVRIHSEVGRGTSITVYLPRHLGDLEREAVPIEPGDLPRAESGETVLVVDDEASVRMLVTDVLQDLGYAALEACDGPGGIAILRSDARVDLLVTDVGLPGGMNGRQVADAARVLRPGLKVLFITGYAENAALSHDHLDPGMHVLTKPFSIDALAARIRNLIEGVRGAG